MSESVSITQWAERWWHVLRAHRTSQLGWRAAKIVQRRFFPLLPKSRYKDVDGSLLRARGNQGLEKILQRHIELRSQQSRFTQRIDRLLRGEFCFLNESRQLGTRADVELANVAPVSHLWRFHLHYHEHLLDLLAAAQAKTHPGAADRILELIDVWIEDHPIDRAGALGDAWHPFCLSRRVPVWLLVWQAGLIPHELQSRFAISLEAQIRYLERHLEWDLRGNHLLENLRALSLVGAFFDGQKAEVRLHTAGRHLETQLVEQILPSGEHFERSPMYHAQMLAAVLDIRDASAGPDSSLSELCDSTARKMATFLAGVLHPDGQIPLLADSALDETPSPQVLIGAAHQGQSGESVAPRQPSKCLGNYWVWRDAEDYLLFDAGPVGADELPAHAHADLLTIEASLAGERVIVDSGVYDYERSEMRRYCRSTAAHNVLQVGGAEQCDLWSRFRMGRRGRPTSLVTGVDRAFTWAGATHDAYRYCGVPVIGRWIACRPGGPWIIVDWAQRESEQVLSHWLHLAPETTIEPTSDREFRLGRRTWSGTLHYLAAGTATVERAWYCPEFGVRHCAPALRFQQSTASSGLIVTVLSWDESLGTVTVNARATEENVIVWSHDAEQIQWSPQRLVCPTDAEKACDD